MDCRVGYGKCPRTTYLPRESPLPPGCDTHHPSTVNNNSPTPLQLPPNLPSHSITSTTINLPSCHQRPAPWPDNTGMMHWRLAFLIVALHATLSHAESNPFGVLRHLSNYKNVPAGKPWLLLPRGGSTSAKDFRRNGNRAGDFGQIITAAAESDDLSEYSNTFVVKRDGRTELLDKVKVNKQNFNFNQRTHQPHESTSLSSHLLRSSSVCDP
jgi:hypothetical protein